MFSILVSELTPQLIVKAEYWRLFAQMADGRMWADTRHRDSLCIMPAEESLYPLMDKHSDFNAYAGHVRCFPVTLSPDGTEVRLECPRMLDEVDIGLKNQQWFHDGRGIVGLRNPEYWGGQIWIAIDQQAYASDRQIAPTPEHYPRRTLNGVWVWSTRR